MKLMTLNIWGGTRKEDLIRFLVDYEKQIDVFCLQEVFHWHENKILRRSMCANIFEQIKNALPEHQAFFVPQLKGYDLGGKVDFELEWGLALFVKKNIMVEEINDFYIYRCGYNLVNNDIRTIPRNFQYIRVIINGKPYLISHFHGVWYPKDKSDTDDRLEQSRIVRRFLSKRSEGIILCGDFNLGAKTESLKILESGMRNLVKDNNITTTRNELYKGQEKQADYILVSHAIKVRSFKVVEVKVSDHLPLVVDFE